ncbi:MULTISPECIES: ABC transporter permease [unclassified Nostoc]|uniref:ABC transporter permease n=1 Tax=unclassified Nostoc TaxID=2593658 RepID=UPI0013CF6581|nr:MULTISPECIES: ABC transporter permease [unclassified Nostoc]MBE8999013.1 ABC transporter permease [Nostoc sp. LEGE 12447]NEU82115.1 FtsX-like permease family protein [Nostoc sp. UIC 10630]
MNLLESTQMAVKTLAANKLRSMLTMLGIIIGNASVITMIAIGQGAQKFTQEKLESLGPNQLSVFAGGDNLEGLSSDVPSLFLADAQAIATMAPAVREVAPQISSNLQLSRQGRISKVNVTGTTPGILYVRNLQVHQGRFFDPIELNQNSQVVILGPVVARKLFGNENPIGQLLQMNNLSFQVIGIMQAKGAFMGNNPDDIAYVPISTMADQLVGRRSPNGIPIDYLELSAKNQDSIRAAAFQTINILTRRRGRKDFTVAANKSVQDLINQVTINLSLVLAAIAGISLFVGGIGIMNIMLVSVTERTQEIGLRKAIGATEKAILTQFLIEAIILSVTGGLVGTGIGVSSALIVAMFSPLQPSVPIGAIFLTASISGSIGLIFGVAPARKAARLDPIAALRGI